MSSQVSLHMLVPTILLVLRMYPGAQLQSSWSLHSCNRPERVIEALVRDQIFGVDAAALESDKLPKAIVSSSRVVLRQQRVMANGRLDAGYVGELARQRLRPVPSVDERKDRARPCRRSPCWRGRALSVCARCSRLPYTADEKVEDAAGVSHAVLIESIVQRLEITVPRHAGCAGSLLAVVDDVMVRLAWILWTAK